MEFISSSHMSTVPKPNLKVDTAADMMATEHTSIVLCVLAGRALVLSCSSFSRKLQESLAAPHHRRASRKSVSPSRGPLLHADDSSGWARVTIVTKETRVKVCRKVLWHRGRAGLKNKGLNFSSVLRCDHV